jgi:predicted MFS family arabinose efflux permease
MGWEWVLWINTPIGIAAAAIAPALLPKSSPTKGSFDAAGALAVTAGLTLLVYSLLEDLTLAPLAAALLAAFLVIEHRSASPLVPLGVFRRRSLTGAAVTGTLMGGAMIGLFFFATLYLQQVLGYGPLKAGVAFLPLALTIGASAGLASNLATKMGPRPVLAAGLVVQAAGLYWFSHVSAGGSFLADVLFPSLVVALGMGLAFVPLTILAMSGVSESESGLASGVMATAQQIGQAVGLAVLTSVAATTVHTPAALTAGFQDAFLVAAAMALVGAVIAIGRTGEPVPPRSLSGKQTKSNSLTPSAASSSR